MDIIKLNAGEIVKQDGIPMRLLSDVLVECSTVAIDHPENETTDQPKG